MKAGLGLVPDPVLAGRMNYPRNVVSIHPYFKVSPERMAEFRAGLAAFIERTASEPGALFYEFTAQGDEIFCREGYAGAEAALAHLQNVGDLLAAGLKIATLTRLEFHGPTEELAKMRGPLAHLPAVWFERIAGLRLD